MGRYSQVTSIFASSRMRKFLHSLRARPPLQNPECVSNPKLWEAAIRRCVTGSKLENYPAMVRRSGLQIPCLLMRGGTARGLYFLKEHLPQDRTTLDAVLLQAMGSPDPYQIDGLGGATATTSKVALLSRSHEPGIDVDFLFAQVSVTTVDWGPTCGNILAGVGPAAVEMGLVPDIGDSETRVRIRLVNTGAYAEAVVQTPGKQVTYEGEAGMDGLPGTAAPVELTFLNVAGSKTGALLPTGRLRDTIHGVEVTCIDCAVPTIVARASALGKTGYESKLDLDLDLDFFRRVEGIRRTAGAMMGLGDVAGRVTPKFAIVAEPRGRGSLTVRYFVPTATHPAMAVTGAIAIACCSILEGTVAYEVSAAPAPVVVGEHTHNIILEHPSGEIRILLKTRPADEEPRCLDVCSAGVVRTARLLFSGMVRVPDPTLIVTQPEEFREMSQQFSQLFRPRRQALRGGKPSPHSSRAVNLRVSSHIPVVLVHAMAVPAVRCAPLGAYRLLCGFL